MFREICTFNPFSFYSLSLWVQLPTLLFDDDVFLSFFGTCLWLWTLSPVFLVLRDYPMRLCSAAPTVPPTSELMGNVSPLLNTPTEQERKKKERKTVGIIRYWIVWPLTALLIFPASSSPSSNPHYVTSVCYLGPQLCLRRELLLILFFSFYHQCEWLKMDYQLIYIYQIKEKDCSSIIVIKSGL